MVKKTGFLVTLVLMLITLAAVINLEFSGFADPEGEWQLAQFHCEDQATTEQLNRLVQAHDFGLKLTFSGGTYIEIARQTADSSSAGTLGAERIIGVGRGQFELTGDAITISEFDSVLGFDQVAVPSKKRSKRYIIQELSAENLSIRSPDFCSGGPGSGQFKRI
jgi:hypothetical protein